MMRALWTAASGMEAKQLALDVLAHNLANVNTVGFKRGRVDFQDLFYQSLRPAGVASSARTQVPTGIMVGLGVRPAAVQKIFQEGELQRTGNPLDLAIEGDGFFQVTLPNGQIAYTRCGALKLDRDGRIVTSDGYPLEPEIDIPSDAVEVYVSADGTVSVLLPEQESPSEVGNIELAKFPNPAGLRPIGRNLYLPTDSSGDPYTGTPGEEGFGTISQGFLEMSNVSVVEEMVNLIMLLRAYELNAKAVQTADEMLRVTNEVKR